MIIRSFVKLLIVLFVYSPMHAVVYQPWLGDLLELNWRNDFTFQNYSSIDSGGHLKRYKNHDLFLTSSLYSSLPNLESYAPEYSLEVELTQASTRRQSGGLDNFKITGRYGVWDDIAEDAYSLTIGLSYIQAFTPSLHDISSFHHGHTEGEFFLSFGKEEECLENWQSRWWIATALGFAEKGNLWSRFNFSYAYRFSEKHELEALCHSLFGFGHKRLEKEHFHGYGYIDHRSVDLGVKYTYLIDYFGSLSFQYTNRVYARNFPTHTNRFLIELQYDFGINQLYIPFL